MSAQPPFQPPHRPAYQPPHRPAYQPQAVFSGAWVDTATGGSYPAQATLHNGMVTLWVASPTGWTPRFSVPANQVIVKSAAQRITLVVQGRSYPILADPGAVNRATRLTVLGMIGQSRSVPGVAATANVARMANQAGAARAFANNGGTQFLSAMRLNGARVSRLGFGALAAIGCGVALLIAFVFLALTVLFFMA